MSAMSKRATEAIIVRGACQNNLKNLDLELPHGELARCNPVVAPKGCRRSLLSEMPRPPPQLRLPWEPS